MAELTGTWFQPVPSVLIYQISSSEVIDTSGKLAIFDMDWTLIRPIHGKFPKYPTDVAVLPGRIEALQKLIDDGYNIIVVSNQSKQRDSAIKTKIEYVARLFGLPMLYMVSSQNDEYRKPNRGMWDLIKQIFQIDGQKADAFFVGDAAGRPQDFSDSDREWAQNAGISFKTPEEFFPAVLPKIPLSGKNMALMMGMQGSGKSTFVKEHLVPLGYVHINKDTLKDKRRVMKATEDALKAGRSVAIDETNPSIAGRREFYDLAKKYGCNVHVYYLVRNGDGWNKLRPDPVPTIAYNMYYSRLEEPTQHELDLAGVSGDIQEVWY